MIMEWFISRQYIENYFFVTEYWNRDSQSWQDKQGGKGYTQIGAYRLHNKLFSLCRGLKCLSVSAYKGE
jgi:hypothetical protein